ncbi:MAG: hypothetical protein IKJ59_10675 [Clostridia bacterium]|nr:hypothetical protein [Clostridia bacterium]
MEFINLLENMKKDYSNDILIRENKTLLLGLGKTPKCRHMLFAPLMKEHIAEFLVSDYKRTFPTEYIDFLMYSNGANLCAELIEINGFKLAHSMFVLYGLPLTQPLGRPHDMEEPFDIRIEDLSRHKNIPETWLKCGTYVIENSYEDIDIFIDTETKIVNSCAKNTDKIISTWNDIDSCFCYLFNLLNK